MSGRLDVAVFVALALGASACLVVGDGDEDGNNGGSSSGGSPSTGGNPSNGGSPSVGGAGGAEIGGGGSTGNQGGFGGGLECNVPDDCPTPKYYCTDLTCAEGVCGEQYSDPGTPCGDNGDLLCDPDGFCLECLDDNDCVGTDLCDPDTGTCYDPDASGACASTFCLGLPGNNACLGCLITANQTDCQTEWTACSGTGTNGSCTTCNEKVTLGENGAFCVGSETAYNTYVDCVCTSGVCLD